jgi:2-phosphosulfolactate phosphatase
MDYRLRVHELPEATGPDELAGGTVVVIDVLRATTTIIHALAAGAVEVLPCLEIEDARALAAKLRAGEYVLGGERGGLPIPGFHLGNSPAEYTPRSVGGKTVIFTTTNGTRAMMQCRRAAQVFLGAFVNASAVAERLAVGPAPPVVGPAPPAGKAGATTRQGQIHLLCAGSGGEVTRDDVLLAGLLVARLVQLGDRDYQLNAQAAAARDDWTATFPASVADAAEVRRAGFAGRQSRPYVPDPESLAAELRKGRAGQKLVKIGLGADILAAAAIDRFQSVPELDPRTLRIRPS